MRVPRPDDDVSAGVDLRLLRAAVEATGKAILIATADLDEPGPVVVQANPAFARPSGYDAREVVGRPSSVRPSADASCRRPGPTR